MESYKFEFYDEWYGEEIHIITFNGDISNKHINNILNLCIKDLKICDDFYNGGVRRIFFNYLKSNHLKYSDFQYNKEIASFKEDSDRFFYKYAFIFSLERYIESTEFNHYYVIYNDKNVHSINNYNYWCSKIHFVAKKDNKDYKILYLEEKYDDEDLFLDFGIIKNSNLIYSTKFNTYEYEDEENRYPHNVTSMMELSIKEMILLQNIDKINTEEDFEKMERI